MCYKGHYYFGTTDTDVDSMVTPRSIFRARLIKAATDDLTAEILFDYRDALPEEMADAFHEIGVNIHDLHPSGVDYDARRHHAVHRR